MSARDRAAWRLLGEIHLAARLPMLADDEARNLIRNAIDRFDGTLPDDDCDS